MTTTAATRKYWHGIATVYRLYGRGRLLYVGTSVDITGRLKHHGWEHWWWPLVDKVRVQVYADRFTARAAEQAAIRDEEPAYNVRVAGQPDRLSRDHWEQWEHDMAEAHERASYLRYGIDPDTFEQIR